MPRVHRPSPAVKRALLALGADLRDARLRQRLTAAVVAQRAFTSRPSLRRIEAGDTAVSMGIYAAVMQALGLLDRLGELAAPDHHDARQDAESLPQRVRTRRRARVPAQ